MIVRVTIKDDLTKKMAMIQPRIIPALMGIVRESLNIVEMKAKQSLLSRLRVRTGRLLRSVKAGLVKIRGLKIVGKLPDRPKAKGSGWYYGLFHERGAVIKPKKKKWLAIPMPDGTVRFVKKVILPRRPWLAPAIEKSKPGIEKILVKHIDRIFR